MWRFSLPYSLCSRDVQRHAVKLPLLLSMAPDKSSFLFDWHRPFQHPLQTPASCLPVPLDYKCFLSSASRHHGDQGSFTLTPVDKWKGSRQNQYKPTKLERVKDSVLMKWESLNFVRLWHASFTFWHGLTLGVWAQDSIKSRNRQRPRGHQALISFSHDLELRWGRLQIEGRADHEPTWISESRTRHKRWH